MREGFCSSLVAEALKNNETHAPNFKEVITVSVKNGWNYCSCCGYLEPMTREEVEWCKKKGMPESAWKLNKVKI